MAIIVTRAGKGSPLTFQEGDANFINLNEDIEALQSEVGSGGAIDIRLDALESADVVIDSRLDAVEALNVTQDSRLTAIESVNTTQDGQIIALQAADTALDGRIDTLEISGTRYAATKSAGDTLAASLADGATVIVEAAESATPAGVKVRYTVASGVLTSAVIEDSAKVRFNPAGVGAVARTAQDKLREVVSVKDFGAVGDGVTDDTAAIQAAHAASTNVHYPDGSYLIGWAEGTSLVSYTGVSGIKVTGNAKLVDARTYASGSFTNVFKLSNCTDVDIQLGYTGQPIVSKSDPTVGIGYRGANFVKLESGCKRVKVKGRLEYLRYGVVAGDYTTPSLGENDALTIDLTTIECGYPVALYLSTGVDINLRSEGSHRTAYLAGVRGGKCHAYFKDQYIAPIQVLMTDATTNGGTYPAGTSRGCSDLDVIAHDMGSTVFTANSFCAGISMSRGDAGTTYENINVDVYVKSSDTVASTLSAFGLYNSFTGIQPSYPSEWEQTFFFKNIKITGTLDRSAQTISENSANGEIYIFAFISGSNYGTVQGIDIKGFRYYPGSGAKPRGFYYVAPGLVGNSAITDCDFGLETPVLINTNSTSTLSVNNSRMRGSAGATSDSPFNSKIDFINTKIGDALYQPTNNKTFLNTLLNGAGSQIKQSITEIALTGASVTWAGSLPSNAIILGVSGYVTEAITGATGYLAGVSAEPSRFTNTNTLTVGSGFTPANSSATNVSPTYQKGTDGVLITAKTSNFTGGKIRLAVSYILITAPTS